ncbi:MAG: hypothetical protein IJU51_04595 [Clostridia bacterium]|nr:hypothetical protein [Clostridia bacterium]
MTENEKLLSIVSEVLSDKLSGWFVEKLTAKISEKLLEQELADARDERG